MFTVKGLKTVIRGHEAEKLVQKKLWRYGYNVERMPNSSKGQPYDLLVDGKFRVEVKSAMLQNKDYWAFFLNRGLEKDKADIYTFVFLYPDNSSKVFYMEVVGKLENIFKKGSSRICLKPNHELLEKSPLKVFGVPKIKNKPPVDNSLLT